MYVVRSRAQAIFSNIHANRKPVLSIHLSPKQGDFRLNHPRKSIEQPCDGTEDSEVHVRRVIFHQKVNQVH
jgi:hypothetical protein